MDVRCKNCDKLFRVPDSKISGKGIKFACTRCGEYVQISKEEVEWDALAKTAAAASSLSEPKAPPAPKPLASDLELPKKKQTEAPSSAALEVRCGNCSKLFRVPREKVSGKGIKFACTRCGEYVIVAKDDGAEPMQAKAAAPAPDLSDLNPEYAGEQWKPKQQESTATEPVPVPEPAVEPEFTSAQEPVQAPIRVSKVDLEFLPPQEARSKPVAPQTPTPENFFSEIDKTYAAAPDLHDALPREEPLSFAEFPLAVGPEQGLEPGSAHEPGPVHAVPTPSEPAFESEPPFADEPQPGSAEEESRESTVSLEPEPAPLSLPQPPMAQASIELAPKAEPIREAFQASRLAPHPEPPVSEIVIQETVPAAPHRTEKKAALVAPFNWFDKVLLPLLAVIIIGAAGYALFTYHQASMKKEMRAASELLTIEGLLITNVTNSKDSQGDLLIVGTVQNTSDTVKNAWYVVIDVYNAQGGEIDKLRLLNGKQLYSRRDYEILAKRGVNVQDLKAKNLEEQGVPIPSKGSLEFTIRYVQPPDSVAGLNPMLQTFDPVRLFKEIAEDNK